MKFDLYLTGFVGSWEFDRESICYYLQWAQDREVSICIESLGGSFMAGLSIMSAVARHGNVTVHLSGANASAATLVAMGAKRVTIDENASFLVHKAAVPIEDVVNADTVDSFIDSLDAVAEDLRKSDALVAGIYARKCRKTKEQLLELMSEDRWMSPQEALEWGFADEITSYHDERNPHTDAVLYKAIMAAGLPPLPSQHAQKHDEKPASVINSDNASAFAGILAELKALPGRIRNLFSGPSIQDTAMKADTAQLQVQLPDKKAAAVDEQKDIRTQEPADPMMNDVETAPKVMVASRAKETRGVSDFARVTLEARRIYNSLP